MEHASMVHLGVLYKFCFYFHLELVWYIRTNFTASPWWCLTSKLISWSEEMASFIHSRAYKLSLINRRIYTSTVNSIPNNFHFPLSRILSIVLQPWMCRWHPKLFHHPLMLPRSNKIWSAIDKGAHRRLENVKTCRKTHLTPDVNEVSCFYFNDPLRYKLFFIFRCYRIRYSFSICIPKQQRCGVC
jgi:hypothetical protein